jgi:hypothetical protein
MSASGRGTRRRGPVRPRGAAASPGGWIRLNGHGAQFSSCVRCGDAPASVAGGVLLFLPLSRSPLRQAGVLFEAALLQTLSVVRESSAAAASCVDGVTLLALCPARLTKALRTAVLCGRRRRDRAAASALRKRILHAVEQFCSANALADAAPHTTTASQHHTDVSNASGTPRANNSEQRTSTASRCS